MHHFIGELAVVRHKALSAAPAIQGTVKRQHPAADALLLDWTPDTDAQHLAAHRLLAI